MKLLIASFLVWGSTVCASDCGWGNLSTQERNDLMAGHVVQNADWSGGIDAYQISTWGFINTSSMKNVLAQYYDYQTYIGDEKLVEIITLAEGERASDNPARFNVTPKDNNPFGDLYQPFAFSLSVHPNKEAYVIRLETLSSPNLVQQFTTQSCLLRLQDKILLQVETKFKGNPEIGFDFPGFGKEVRMTMWKQLVMSNIAKAQKPASQLQETNLVKALLGNLD